MLTNDFDIRVYSSTEQLSQNTVMRLLEAVVASVPPHDAIALRKMPERVETLANPLWPLTNLSSEASTHAISLARPMEAIEQSIRSIRNIKKHGRALQQMEGYRFFVAHIEAERHAILEVMLRQKQRRFEETMVPGFDVHPEKQRFFEEVTEHLARHNALHLSALAIGETILATVWSVVRNGHNVRKWQMEQVFTRKSADIAPAICTENRRPHVFRSWIWR
ncbi:GNAT family N-acetyltransferase [Brucella pecoris]|uniref:CelD/BcsL family acetyltransferase involved in cellulose biosynthesis n=1 Tax=Brucella pecoris TaxID=867683 RepID=A0AB34YQ15_9HYPH|nr:GNAT family N-acetyltransferase [Brucella pecoris]MBB4093355.1 CelD/BcsL family acetyltransferase involved in cellulose biosynthesis [Brucella pecoris]